MAYDEGLAQRVREMLSEYSMVDEKKMFGGLAFMLEGNVACGVLGDELIVRVGPQNYQESLEKQHIKEFDFTGRPMTGWVMVRHPGYETDQALNAWLELGIEFVFTLAPK